MSLKFLIIWRSLQARIKQKVSRRPEKGRETLMNAIHWIKKKKSMAADVIDWKESA